VHAHREVLVFHKTGADAFWIGIPADNLHVSADALCRGVARFVLLASLPLVVR